MEYFRIYVIVCFFMMLGCTSSDDGWTPLFNGENLEGWHVYGAENSLDGWFVEDGVLVFDYQLKKGGSSNLVTDEKFTNFELSFEWMVSEHGNSGVFWGVVENDEYEHPYQTGPEIQILDDGWTAYVEGRGDTHRAGSLYGLMAPSKIVSRPAGEWNHYLLHIENEENIGFLKFNGQEVLRFPVHGPDWKALIAGSGFADWPGFGKARTGHISLQEYGGKLAFRNIKIKVLP